MQKYARPEKAWFVLCKAIWKRWQHGAKERARNYKLTLDGFDIPRLFTDGFSSTFIYLQLASPDHDAYIKINSSFEQGSLQ